MVLTKDHVRDRSVFAFVKTVGQCGGILSRQGNFGTWRQLNELCDCGGKTGWSTSKGRMCGRSLRSSVWTWANCVGEVLSVSRSYCVKTSHGKDAGASSRHLFQKARAGKAGVDSTKAIRILWKLCMKKCEWRWSMTNTNTSAKIHKDYFENGTLHGLCVAMRIIKNMDLGPKHKAKVLKALRECFASSSPK